MTGKMPVFILVPDLGTRLGKGEKFDTNNQPFQDFFQIFVHDVTWSLY